MTEVEARALLRAWESRDRIELWIADQPWRPNRRLHEGWDVEPDFQGWRFRIDLVPPKLLLKAWAPGGTAPARWTVGPA